MEDEYLENFYKNDSSESESDDESPLKKDDSRKTPPGWELERSTSWKWYPSSLLLTDSNAITSFIESADQSNWSILDDLPSQSSKKLRIVEL